MNIPSNKVGQANKAKQKKSKKNRHEVEKLNSNNGFSVAQFSNKNVSTGLGPLGSAFQLA